MENFGERKAPASDNSETSRELLSTTALSTELLTPAEDRLAGPKDMLRAAVHTVVQAPVDSLAQMAKEATGADIKPFEVISAPKQANLWSAGGTIVGSVGQFILVSKALRMGLARAGTLPAAAPTTFWEAGLAGGAVEIIHPLSAEEKGNFWIAKGRSAGVAFGTFATMAGMSQLFSEADLVRRVGRRSIMENAGMHGFTGLTGGLTNAQLDANLRGEFLLDPDRAVKKVGEFVTFGTIFGAAEAAIGRSNFELKAAENTGRRTNVPTTEEWINNHSTGDQPLRSSLLSWIAETRPHLRPPIYEAYRAKLAVTPTEQVRPMALSDWPVQQRPALLAEIRNLASDTQFAKDANIDAFISRLNVPELQAYSSPARVAARDAAYKQLESASENLSGVIKGHPELREMGWSEIDAKVQAQHPELAKALANLKSSEDAFANLVKQHLGETNLEEAMRSTLSGIAREAGLPKLRKVEVKYDDEGGWYKRYDESLGYGQRVVSTGHSAETAEASVHEMVHHDVRPGFWRRLFENSAEPQGSPANAQARITEELELLSRPGGTADLLRRLSQPGVTGGALSQAKIPRDVDYYVSAYREGRIDTARWQEAEINKALREALEQSLVDTRMQAWNRHMSYVGSAMEQPAWASGFLARVRARALGVADLDMALGGQGSHIIRFSSFGPEASK